MINKISSNMNIVIVVKILPPIRSEILYDKEENMAIKVCFCS